MTDAQRRKYNAERLLKVWSGMRPKIRAILDDLEGHGHIPLIAHNVWRSPSEQRQLVREGKSKLLYGFHNVTQADGDPESLAVDIVDARYPYNEPTKFFLHLRSSAQAHEMTTGATFGLSTKQVQRLDDVIINKDWGEKVHIGWDPWHCQPLGITPREAKAGKRPKFE